MTIEEMKERKKELGYSNEMIAQLSGIPESTVQKVLGGVTKSPRYETVAALEKVLSHGTGKAAGYKSESADAGTGKTYSERRICETDIVCESTPAYNVNRRESYEEMLKDKSGKYTLADYYALPDEIRAELIDGVFYDMASPTYIHQLIAGRIFYAAADYINKKGGKCLPFTAPLDVQLDKDDKTILEPDMLIVCDRGRFERGIVYGAPDFVVEVLSKSTASKDSIIKLNKYFRGGVREYWIISPWQRTITVHMFENDYACTLYNATDKVPVGIFNNECIVDFAPVFELIDELEGKEQ